MTHSMEMDEIMVPEDFGGHLETENHQLVSELLNGQRSERDFKITGE